MGRWRMKIWDSIWSWEAMALAMAQSAQEITYLRECTFEEFAWAWARYTYDRE